MSVDLGQMVVSFAANLTGLADAIVQVTDQLGSMPGVAEEASSGMSGAVSGMESSLTGLAENVTETSTSLTSIPDAADEAAAGVAAASSEMEDNLASVADQAEQTNQQVAKPPSSGGFLSGIGGMAKGVMGFVNQAGLGIMSARMLGQTALGLGSALLGPAAAAEQTTDAFANLLHSTKAAHQEMQSLNTFAAQTPFDTKDIQSGAEKLIAFGVNAKDVIPDLKGIGDSISDLGHATPAELDSIVNIFGKIQASGKLTGGDIMQLSSHGINALQMLSQEMGVPTAEIQKMASKGLIPAKEALTDLTKGMEATFGGGMAQQASTFNGQMSTLRSNWNNVMIALGTPVLKVAEQGLSQLGNIVSSPKFQQFATVVGTDIGNAISTFATGVQKAGQFLGSTLLPPLDKLGTALAPIVGPMGQWAQQSGVLQIALGGIASVALPLLITGLGGLITGLADAVTFFSHNQVAADGLIGVLTGIGVAISAAVLPGLIAAGIAATITFSAWAIGAAAAAIATLTAAAPFILIGAIVAVVVVGIILAIQHWSDITKVLKSAWSAVATFFSDLWAGIVSGVTGFVGNVGNDLNTLGKNIDSFFGGLAAKAVAWGQGLINGFISGIKNMAGAVGSAAEGVMKDVENFLGFKSPAKKGPGQHIVTYGANMVNGFVQGMNSAAPLAAHASSKVAQAATGGLSGLAVNAPTLGQGNYAGMSSSMLQGYDKHAMDAGKSLGVQTQTATITAQHATTHHHTAAHHTATHHAAHHTATHHTTKAPQQIILEIDGQQFAELLLPYLGAAQSAHIRVQTGFKGAL